MKVIILLLAVAAARAAPQGGYNYAPPEPAPVYNFGYTVDAVDPYRQPVQFGHSEGRDGVKTSGSYYVLLPDTRLMRVSYYVDETGFHPTYTFEGTAVYPQPQPYSGGQAALPTPSQLYGTPGRK
ncbi:pro-resilin-like [Penaeus monodon]|uniref:pro-resilin-like n=1 Tax=Penaeus monodon TaxID=6687 RepID=UPI0018A734D9|nr:pro-resilin-like [Penaeus monodon]